MAFGKCSFLHLKREWILVSWFLEEKQSFERTRNRLDFKFSALRFLNHPNRRNRLDRSVTLFSARKREKNFMCVSAWSLLSAECHYQTWNVLCKSWAFRREESQFFKDPLFLCCKKRRCLQKVKCFHSVDLVCSGSVLQWASVIFISPLRSPVVLANFIA